MSGWVRGGDAPGLGRGRPHPRPCPGFPLSPGTTRWWRERGTAPLICPCPGFPLSRERRDGGGNDGGGSGRGGRPRASAPCPGFPLSRERRIRRACPGFLLSRERRDGGGNDEGGVLDELCPRRVPASGGSVASMSSTFQLLLPFFDGLFLCDGTCHVWGAVRTRRGDGSP